MIKFNAVVIFIFIKLLSFSVGVYYPPLQLMSVVFRHGDRLPDDTVAGDLTNAGRQRAYHLGEALHAKYADFLGDIYEPAAVSARSTEYRRAKMSLQLLLAGLYTPQRHQRWHELLAWQPIPFTYAPEDDDILLFPKFCPRFQKELKKVRASTEVQKLIDPYREMLKNISMLTGTEEKDSNDMFLLYHALSAMKALNESLPEWADNIFPNGALLQGTYLEYDVLKFSDWMRRINGGSLVRKILDDMLNKMNDESPSKRKIYLYSTHELIIVSILQTLKIWKPHIPDYSNAVIIELREDRKIYYIKILYYNGVTSTFKEMQIPGCLIICPLTKIIDLISDNLPDYDEIICDEKPVALHEKKMFYD